VARVRDIGRGRFNRRYIGRPKTISRVVTFVPTMDDTTLSLSFSLSLSSARSYCSVGAELAGEHGQL